MKNKLKLIAGFSFGPILSALIGFITVPIISRFINADQFGLASMFTVLNNALVIMSLIGFDQAYMREYNEIEDRSKLFTNALLVPLFIISILGLIIIIFRNEFALLLFNNKNMYMPVVALVISMPMFIIEKFFLLNIRMQSKGMKYSIWSIVSRVLNLFIVVLLLKFYKSTFESVVYSSLLSQLIASFAILLFEYKSVFINLKKIDKIVIMKLLKYGIPLLPATCMNWALSSTDIIFLRAMSSYSEVGYYSVALKFVTILLIVQTSFANLWAPVAFKWYKDKVSNVKFERVAEIISFMMVLLFNFVLLFKWLIPVVISHEYTKTIYILPFLLFYPVFYTISETISVGISFSRKTYYNILISVISLIINLFCNYYLIPIYGGIGAACATGVSYLIFFWARAIISRKLWYKFPLCKFIIITVEMLCLALLNAFCKNLVFISIINFSCLIFNIILYFNVIILIFKRNKIYVGLFCFNTQEKQLKNLINYKNVKCIECINQSEKKIIKLFKLIFMLLTCDVIYYGYGECKKYRLIHLLNFFHKKIIFHWIGSDVLNAHNLTSEVKLIQNYVDMNFACSELISSELKTLNINAFVIPILPPLSNYELSSVPKKHAVLSYIPNGKEKFYGIDYIAEGAKKYPNVIFYIVGNDNDTLNLKNVKFLGKVSSKEMINLYDEISLLIRLPEHDGLSLMLIEALLKGKDVIYCYDFPFCYSAQNNDKFLNELDKIFKSKPKLNIDGRNYVLKEFNFDNIQLTLWKNIIKIVNGDFDD